MENSNKKIAIAGSTGSIGTQSLSVARKLNLQVTALSANSNIKLLEEQIREFKPKIAAVTDEKHAQELKVAVADTGTKIVSGIDGLCEVTTEKNAELVITSVVGMIGLLPTIEAIKAKKNIGLANKETLVTAGSIIKKLAKENNVQILPVDSEHSAIFQCLQGCHSQSEVKKIILTASGGPFFGKSLKELKEITPKDALAHPNWSMGRKISIDSATLMNKGLEFIEAYWLFDVTPEQIEVVIHRESVIHSLVEFCDNSVLAQLGTPDMTIPIQYAITYPYRTESTAKPLSLTDYGSLSFYKPDMKTFRLLPLCMKAIEVGHTLPCAVNAANEESVELFLQGKISFTDIFDVVEETAAAHKLSYNPTYQDILNTEREARAKVIELAKI